MPSTYLLPQHRDRYRVAPENRSRADGDPNEVRMRLPKPPRERFHILGQGQALSIQR